MSEARIGKLEAIAERHDSDLHRIAGAMDRLVGQGEKTNSLLQDALIRDERFDAKVEKLEQGLSAKILANNAAITRSHERTDKIDEIINRLAWTIISVVILGALGAVIKFGG